MTVTVTEPAPQQPAVKGSATEEQGSSVPAAVTSYDGEYFSVAYPLDWELESAEISKGSYLDTTIRDPVAPDVMLRVDVTPGSNSDPEVAADEVEAYLSDQPGYRRLRYQATNYLGYEAFRWDFLVQEDGVVPTEERHFL